MRPDPKLRGYLAQAPGWSPYIQNRSTPAPWERRKSRGMWVLVVIVLVLVVAAFEVTP